MSVHETARILANHQRTVAEGSCICGEWPTDGHLEPWTLHLAKALHPDPPQPWAHPNTQIGRK